MRRITVFFLILMLGPLAGHIFAAPKAGRETAPKPAPPALHVAQSQLEDFLGEAVFIPMQELWKGRGGTSIVTARNGTAIAFQSLGSNKIRRSTDGGRTWEPDRIMGPDAKNGKAVVDDARGDILYVNPIAKLQWRSRDCGATWTREEIDEVRPDGFGFVPSSVSCMQSGITLLFGEHRGRLIMPARIMGPQASNDVAWRSYHYSTALYSDDGGKIWRTSKPFPVLGTGEAALAETSDGRVMYNSREHMSRNNRFIAWSDDGGDTWLNPYQSAELPDGAKGTSYGCMGGMIRLPIAGRDILIYSNLDTDSGEMPGKVGASTSKGRENVTVWASFDGGRTWPVKRLVYGGPSAYSNLAAGRPGTPSAGKIFILFEGGPAGYYDGIQVAAFNLSWILNDRNPAQYLK